MTGDTFGTMLRVRREALGLSLSALGKLTSYSPSYISKLEHGHKQPTTETAEVFDRALSADGALVAAVPAPVAIHKSGLDMAPWDTAELLRRAELSDVEPSTIDGLQATVERLCCEYPYRSAADLRAEATQWLRYIGRLLTGSVSLRQHRELLVTSGWLALLIGCVEYDLDMPSAAETTRLAAQQIGDETGHSEIVGWAHEMTAWFALTQGRYRQVIDAADAGQRACGSHSVTVQLSAQRAKALARIGDVRGVHRALERGQQLLDRLPYPAHPENHFVVDPDKWDYYAMDCLRVVRDDEPATRFAADVVTKNTNQDGTLRAPMRVAEARFTLGVVSVRRGDLESALSYTDAGLRNNRRSVLSLALVGGELAQELNQRYPNDRAAADLRERLHAIHSS